MAINYEANFHLNVLKASGNKLLTGTLNRLDKKRVKCHLFSKQNIGKQGSGTVEIFAGKIVDKQWLYGPATILETKTVIYPCSQQVRLVTARTAQNSFKITASTMELSTLVASFVSR